MDLLFENPIYFFRVYMNFSLLHFCLAWIVITVALYFLKGKNRNRVYFIWCLITALFIAFVIGICLFNRNRITERVISLELLKILKQLDVHRVREIGSNMVLFLPLGFMFYGRIRNGLITVVLGFALSVCIECLQYLWECGNSELIDVISNTVGMLLGVGCFALIKSRLPWQVKKKYRKIIRIFSA